MKNSTYTLYFKTQIKKIFYSYASMMLTLFCLGGTSAWGDSTYFPEDIDNPPLIDEEVANPINNHGAGTPKKFQKMIKSLEDKAPSSKVTTDKGKPSQPISLTPSSKSPDKKPIPTLPEKPLLDVPSLPLEKNIPENFAKVPSPMASEISPVHNQPLPAKEKPFIASNTAPLPVAPVAPHPKVHPLPEKEITQPPSITQKTPSETIDSYSSVAKDKLLLGQLDPNKDIRSQKWYIYAATKRGIKKQSDPIEIVSVEGKKGPSSRGKEVVALLIEMGLKPEQLRLINTKDAEEQTGQIYIYGGK